MTVSIMKKNSKVPGILGPPPKSEIDGKIANLSSKTIPELLEIRDRQQKLLSNKAFTSKLPDKGGKIQVFLDRVFNEISLKKEENEACRLLSKLKLDKASVQDMEWENKGIRDNRNACLDSDDDSEPEDLFNILSQSTLTERKVKILPPEKSLVTSADLENIEEVPHVKYIVNKTEHKSKPKTQFKPHKTTRSDSHNPEKEIMRRKHKKWEVTAATPPPIVHEPAQVLSLEESLKLQKEYNIHLKEVEAKHAAEKLLVRAGIKMLHLPEDVSILGDYREVSNGHSEESDDEGSENEVHDDEPERGGVVFTVMK